MKRYKDRILALLDQGLFALSNFGTSVLMARMLSKEDFGLFSIVQMVILVVGTFHAACVSEPLMVLGPRKPLEQRGPLAHALNLRAIPAMILLGAGLTGTWSLTPALQALLSWQAIGAACLSAMATFMLWTFRQSAYCCHQLPRSCVAGIIYMAALLGLAQLMDFSTDLAIAKAFLVTSAASILAGVLIMPSRKPGTDEVNNLSQSDRDSIRSFTRSSLPTAAIALLPSFLPGFLVPVFANLEASALYRALSLLTMPYKQYLTSISRIQTVQHAESGSLETGLENAAIEAKRSLVLSLPVVLGVTWLGGWIAPAVFGPLYRPTALELFLASAPCLVLGCTTSYSSLLRAMNRPDLGLRVEAVISTVCALSSLVLGYFLGLVGILASASVVAITRWICVRRALAGLKTCEIRR